MADRWPVLSLSALEEFDPHAPPARGDERRFAVRHLISRVPANPWTPIIDALLRTSGTAYGTATAAWRPAPCGSSGSGCLSRRERARAVLGRAFGLPAVARSPAAPHPRPSRWCRPATGAPA